VSIHSDGGTETGAYENVQGVFARLLSFLFGSPEELKHKREKAQTEHPGATLDALDHIAANEDDVGGME
jgi:hypothetical protein